MTSLRRICDPLSILALVLLTQPVAAAAIPTTGISADALAVSYRPYDRQRQWGYRDYRHRVPPRLRGYRYNDRRALYYPYFEMHRGHRYHSRPYFRTPLYYQFHF